MKPCTLWYRWVPISPHKEECVFNHLADGHEQGAKPAPMHEARKAWARAEWGKTHAWLTDDVPPKVVHYGPEDL